MNRHERKMYRTLETLGDTAQEVAASLYTLGIRGRKFMACDCPVANFINFKNPEGFYAWVGGGRATWWHPRLFRDHKVCNIRILPIPVLDFVRDFDNGAFEELISDGEN